jgi:hypothetical protein
MSAILLLPITLSGIFLPFHCSRADPYHSRTKLATDAAEEAGKLILNLKELWAGANLTERRQLLLSMLDAVYFDTKKSKSIIAIRPKPPFKPVFQVAASKEGSGIRIVNEPYLGSSVFVVEAGERACLIMSTVIN